MHGRPRKPRTPEDDKALALKAAKLRSLQSQFLQNHHNKDYTKEALELSAKLVEANPEFYTAWNYRRLAIEHILNQSETDADPKSIKSVLDEELRVVENALHKNFKSYGAWHHRKWVLSKGHCSTDRELKLLNTFQKADARNFHAWNYRRFVTALKNISDEDEFQYTTDMIEDNFSNYSAWHNRSVLLSHLLEKRVKGFFPKKNVLAEEFEFVRHALFTDPDDQSGWFYHLWLLYVTVNLESPFLLSSWPPNGSALYVPINGLHGSFLFPLTSSRMFPLVLYFNEVVEGVNSSTVIIESEYDANTNHIWRPLSGNSSACAQAWVTYLNFPDELHSSKLYMVKVHVGYSQGIVSLGGSYYQPCCVEFTVSRSPCGSEHAEGQSLDFVSWRDENFAMCEANLLDSSPLNTLHKRPINEHNELSEWKAEIVKNEIDHCRELLSSMNCKIGKLTLARLLIAHEALMSYSNPNVTNAVHFGEILELFRDLIEFDQPHSQYYKDEYSLVMLKQVTSSRESVLGYSSQYRETTSSSIKDFICLRLNNLSLSRIGSVERLLWVQMLDLSDNQLRSIEGLEAMQLLRYLNLSKNRLCSFTALEPLRLLKSLTVLNISYNEIGSHSVDTRRYLCSSPFSHTAGCDWDKFGDGLEATNYWEAFSTLKGLHIRQLDIVGNPIADENFKFFIFKILPKLKWLDGEASH